MLIPTVIKAEAHDDMDDMPTLQGSQASKMWSDAALLLSRKFVECGRLKMRCPDIFDSVGAESAFRLAKELQQLSVMLEGLSSLQPETAAVMRRHAVDRIMKIYELSSHLLPLISAAAAS